VIAHEWDHELMHDQEKWRSLSHQVKECHAEATAFVVFSHFGLEIPYSAEHLVHWGNNLDNLRKELDLVTHTASLIIAKIDALNPEEVSPHDNLEM
jgi:hypothetical protein